MTKAEYRDRILVLVFGLVFMALGISFTVNSNLGVTPILCPIYLLNLFTSLSIGQYLIILQFVFILVKQLIVKKYTNELWIRLVIAVVLGLLVDLASFCTYGLIITSYLDQIFFLLLGSVLMAIGMTLQITSKVILLSAEDMMLAISDVKKCSFSKVKMCFDISFLIVGLVLSLSVFGVVIGIREGTFISFFLVGLLSGRIQPLLGINITNWFERKENKEPKSDVRVITIAREFGSGGHEIGQKIADRLGWTFIDQQLIDSVAEKNGLSTAFVVKKDQKMSAIERLWKDVWMDNIQSIENRMTDEDRLFEAQSKEICDAAEKGNCVIVGRCANKILKHRTDCVHIFISSDIDFACKRVSKEFGYTIEDARIEIENVNEMRATHYNYYTGGMWGEETEYDWRIKSSDWGIDESVDMIISFAGL